MKRPDSQEAERDHSAMEAASRGERWAFEYLVGRYQGALINYFLRHTGNLEAAKELSQEVFLRLYTARHRYRPETKFTTYLFTIAHNLVVNEVFAKRRPEFRGNTDEAINAVPSADDGPEESLITKEEKKRVTDALLRLSVRERSALTMKYTEGMSYAEIASAIGASVPAVESLLSRAKEKMRKSLRRSAREG